MQTQVLPQEIHSPFDSLFCSEAMYRFLSSVGRSDSAFNSYFFIVFNLNLVGNFSISKLDTKFLHLYLVFIQINYLTCLLFFIHCPGTTVNRPQSELSRSIFFAKSNTSSTVFACFSICLSFGSISPPRIV